MRIKLIEVAENVIGCKGVYRVISHAGQQIGFVETDKTFRPENGCNPMTAKELFELSNLIINL